jgi:hypothetical protein
MKEDSRLASPLLHRRGPGSKPPAQKPRLPRRPSKRKPRKLRPRQNRHLAIAKRLCRSLLILLLDVLKQSSSLIDGTAQVVVPDRRISYCNCGRRARRLYCRNGRPENIGKYYYICTNLNSREEPRCGYWHWVEGVADAIRRERVQQDRMMGYWYGLVPERYPQFDPDGDELDDWF